MVQMANRDEHQTDICGLAVGSKTCVFEWRGQKRVSVSETRICRKFRFTTVNIPDNTCGPLFLRSCSACENIVKSDLCPDMAWPAGIKITFPNPQLLIRDHRLAVPLSCFIKCPHLRAPFSSVMFKLVLYVFVALAVVQLVEAKKKKPDYGEETMMGGVGKADVNDAKIKVSAFKYA